MFSLRGLQQWFFVLFCASSLVAGCECGSGPGQVNDPARIDFISPSGVLITDGLIRVRIQDADGTASVVFYIDDVKIDAKEGNNQRDATYETRFDLDSKPKEFRIKVEAIDSFQDRQEKVLSVRQDTAAPFLTFVEPTKIQSSHPTIFIGRRTKVVVDGQDNDGVKEILLEYGRQQGEFLPLHTCQGTNTPNARDRCEHDVDLTNDTEFPDGVTVVFYASATDSKNNPTDVRTRLETLVDKVGPQLQIVRPQADASLRGLQEFRVLALDQVGVKKVEFTLGSQPIASVTEDPANPGQYFAQVDVSRGFGSGVVEFKVVATDALDNVSEAKISVRLGCQSDADCSEGERCCTANSPSNKDGQFSGQCFPVQAQEGALCDPCTTPCGKGGDGRLMGCLPEPCTDQPPFRCRSACYLGDPNTPADACRPAQSGRPAEYCTRSDITRINPTLGACALGHNCDPLNQRTCAAGEQAPYNNCCPAGFACYPADADANFCVPEGNKKQGESNCSNDICSGNNTCERGGLCVVTVDAQGRPTGPPTCRNMCNCDALCRGGFPINSGGCSGGAVCTPLVLTNGRVPLPVGACSQ